MADSGTLSFAPGETSKIIDITVFGDTLAEGDQTLFLDLSPTGIAALVSILATVMLGLPLPYLPAQLLWINLVTDCLPALALATIRSTPAC